MAATEPKKTPAVWMRNLLLGSAAINVFLAGFLFANFLKPDTPKGQKEPTHISLGGLPPDLPPHLVEEFENNFKAHRPMIEKDYRDLVRARVKIGDLLAGVEIDREELNKTLEEIRGLQFEIQGQIHQSMVDTLVKLDPETRKIFIAGGRNGLERGIWTQRQIDGSRWKVVFENGEIIIDLEGLGNNKDNGNGAAPNSNGAK